MYLEDEETKKVSADFLPKGFSSYRHMLGLQNEAGNSTTSDPGSDNLGPDAEIVTNQRGGMQSKVDYRFDLLDPKAMFALTRVVSEGAERYTPGNWRKIPLDDHLNHALIHINAHFAGDTQDDHLAHALCRLMFAVGLSLKGDIND